MKLIDNLGDVPKMYVIWVLTAIAFFNLLWLELPKEVTAELPAGLVHYVNLGLAALGAFARVVKQFFGLSAEPPSAP